MVVVSAAGVFPTDPRGAVGTDLALPHGHTCLDPVDEEATRTKRLFTMGSAGGANDGGVADDERPRPVDAANAYAFDLGLDLVGDPLDFALRHRCVCGVLEACYRSAGAMVAHDAEEERETAGAGMADALERLVERERRLANVRPEPRHGALSALDRTK